MKEKNVTQHIFGSLEGLRGAVLAQTGNRTPLLLCNANYDERKGLGFGALDSHLPPGGLF